jgi:hypothetical protein
MLTATGTCSGPYTVITTHSTCEAAAVILAIVSIYPRKNLAKRGAPVAPTSRVCVFLWRTGVGWGACQKNRFLPVLKRAFGHRSPVSPQALQLGGGFCVLVFLCTTAAKKCVSLKIRRNVGALVASILVSGSFFSLKWYGRIIACTPAKTWRNGGRQLPPLLVSVFFVADGRY